MKKFRKAAALLLVTAIILSSMVCGVFAAEGDETAAAETETAAETVTEENETSSEGFGEHEEAIKALFRFGILDESTFEASAKVTRGDFVAKAMMLKGTDLTKGADTVFSDVKKSDKNSGAIAAAYNMGVVKGMTDGTFRPNDVLTKEQSAKILMSILGYDVYAESYGGYPGGYLSIAAFCGVLKGVKIGDYAECTWDNAAQLIYNAMDTDVLQIRTYPAEEYFSNDGETPMNLWMGIYMEKGVIDANDTTSLTSPDGVKDGMVRIGSSLYYDNGTGASDCLGYPVKAYYKLDANDERVMMRVKPDRSVREEVIDAESVDGKTTPSKVYWFEDGRNTATSMSIASAPTLFYNGKLSSKALTADLLQPETGEIKLVDTDGDKKAELVFIESSEIYVVKSVAPAARSIKDKYDKGTLTLDPKDSEIVVKVTKDGEEISFADIAVNNVCRVTKSEDGKLVLIDVSSKKIKGRVEEKGTDSLTVDGETYKIVKSNKSHFDYLNIGDKSIFYLASSGRIAGYGTATSADTKYGYLIIGSVDMKGLSAGKNANLRIFTLDGNVEQYKTASNISLNGSRTNSGGTAYDGDLLLYAIRKRGVTQPTYKQGDSMKRYFCNQLIKYTLNSNDEITEIETPTENRKEYGGTGFHTEDFSIDYSFHSSSSWAAYKSFGFIDGRYHTTGATSLRIPNDTTWGKFYRGEEDLSRIEKQIKLFSTSEWPNDYALYNVDIYNVKDNNAAGIIIEQPQDTGSGSVPKYDVMMVDKVATIINDEEEVAKTLYACYNRYYGSWEFDDEVSVNGEAAVDADVAVSGLKQGDVIRVATDSNNKITSIYKIFSLGKRDGYLLNGTEFNDYAITQEEAGATYNNYVNQSTCNWNIYHNVIHGKITDVDGTTLVIEVGESADGRIKPSKKLLTYNYNSKVYVYDENAETVTVGDINSIDPYNPNQTVVVRQRYFEAYEVNVINRKNDPGTINWVGGYSD